MISSRPLRVIVALDAILMAYGHATLARIILAPFPMALPIGGYFLISTIIYVLGALFVASGKMFKLSNVGLIALAIVDNILLVYTRTMPSIFFGRIIPWSLGWYPLGTVQVLIGQICLIVLCAILYESK